MLLVLISILFTNIIAKNFKSLYMKNHHIHHWMWGLIGLIISYISKLKNLTYIFFGIVLEGLSYNDRFVI
jgi:hypothetical protein